MAPAGPSGKPDAKSKSGETEFLIGENFYGSVLPEEVEARLIDSRQDHSVRADVDQHADSLVGDRLCAGPVRV